MFSAFLPDFRCRILEIARFGKTFPDYSALLESDTSLVKGKGESHILDIVYFSEGTSLQKWSRMARFVFVERFHSFTCTLRHLFTNAEAGPHLVSPGGDRMLSWPRHHHIEETVYPRPQRDSYHSCYLFNLLRLTGQLEHKGASNSWPRAASHDTNHWASRCWVGHKALLAGCWYWCGDCLYDVL